MNPTEIGLIDSRNEKLWQDLIKSHDIELAVMDYPSYAVDSQNEISTIIIPENDIDINSFTHELLHILLRQKEQFFGARFRNLVLTHEVLNQILSEDLLEHFGNCMDHIKMLPIYLELGFDKKKFIMDYDVNKCTKGEIKQLKDNFKINGSIYYGAGIDFYLAKYIAVKSDPKQHINYPKSLQELKNLDSKLFGVLEKCVVDWNKMPLIKENIMDEDYLSIATDFFESLSEWTEGKTFV